jgi:ketosteroid isomerase-like protein
MCLQNVYLDIRRDKSRLYAQKKITMKSHILFFALFFIAQFSFAQSRAEKRIAEAKATVENLERQRFEAQVKKDFSFLEKVFADDLIYTHSGGKQDTKTSYINSIREGKSVYDKIEVEEIIVRPYNKEQTAVVNGVILITQPPVDGKPVLLHIRYAVVYIKDKLKGWQLVMWQSLKLAK